MICRARAISASGRFYVDAMEPPYAANLRKSSYLTEELPAPVADSFLVTWLVNRSLPFHGRPPGARVIFAQVAS